MITRLPNYMDPNALIREKMHKKYMLCPFCGETKEYDLMYNGNGISMFTHVNRKFKRLDKKIFSKRHYCIKDAFKCRTCGAEWETPYYPQDLTIDVDFAKLTKQLIKEDLNG